MLRKPGLDKRAIARIKKVAKEPLEQVRHELEQIEDWRAKQATRDNVRTKILDFLYSDSTGLPVGVYSEDEVRGLSERVFVHFLETYDSPHPSVYQDAA